MSGKLGRTDVLSSTSWKPEKLATRRLSATLLPGVKEPGGPLSCGHRPVRVRGGAVQTPPATVQPQLSLPPPPHRTPLPRRRPSHLQKDWSYGARLGRSPVQALAASVLAHQLQGKGAGRRQQCGRQ